MTKEMSLRKVLFALERKYLIDNAELMSEWDWKKNEHLSPQKITLGSNKLVWWICDKGHSYQSPVNRRIVSGCPFCSGRIAIPGENDLQTLSPEIAKQWHFEKNFPHLPSEFKPRSSKSAWWICDNGHEYKATISNRLKGEACPYCSNRKVLSGYNDLATINPQFASEWHPYKNGDLTPDMVTPKGDTVVWWKCSVCGHEWKVSLNSRQGCPMCSAKRTTSFPEQAIYFYVSQIFSDAKNRYRFRNYEFDIYIPSLRTAIEYDGVFFHDNERARKKDAIKDQLCQQEGIRLIRFRDPKLESTSYAEIIQCSDSYKNTEFEQALKKLLSLLDRDDNIIDLKRDWKTIQEKNAYYYRQNSLANTFPEIAKQWNYDKNGTLSPHNFTSHSNRKVWWRCENGHEWEAVIGSRTRGVGCPYCSGRKVITGKNDLQTLRPEIAAEWNYEKNAPLTPDNIASHSNKRVWWKCSLCAKEWQTSVSNRDIPHCSSCNRSLIGKKFRKMPLQVTIWRRKGPILQSSGTLQKTEN